MSWVVHGKAWAETEWQGADPWNEPTSATLEPGETKGYGLEMFLADGVRDIDDTLREHDRPVALGVPGYIVPQDVATQLYLDTGGRTIREIASEPSGALEVAEMESPSGEHVAYAVTGSAWGRSRLAITYDDGSLQTVHYNVTKPYAETAGDLGEFLFTKQWFDDETDPFGRAPSIITYDRGKDEQVTQDSRAWFAGLSDEAGSGSWLAAAMKVFGLPDKEEAEKFTRFVDETVWGGIQFDEGPKKYGVKKSMFFYDPEVLPDFDYADLNWNTWAAWDKEHADDTGRGYNYPHVIAAYWSVYRTMRNHPGLVENAQHEWDWYLDQAFNTAKFMTGGFDVFVWYVDVGTMDGDVIYYLLEDLRHEGWDDKADELEAAMKRRAEHWREREYPFGSEMAWDSTGQEEVYLWSKYFGFDEKAGVTLDAILGYMPTVPHWGYNGNARRYWDFIYGAAPGQGIERQIHHYGSGINSIPVLSEFRSHPDDLYLLRVGYAGSLGALSAIDEEGFASAAFHSDPAKLRWDDYSGDYGPNFFGHASTTGAYLVEHPELGWLGYGASVEQQGDEVTFKPYDTFRQRVYLAPVGLFLTLDAGRFASVSYDAASNAIELELDPADEHTPEALLRLEQPAEIDGVGTFAPASSLEEKRGGFAIPLGGESTTVELRAGSTASTRK